MAAQNLAALVLAQAYTNRTEFSSQLNRSRVVLTTLKTVRMAGQNVAWSTRMAGATAADHAEGHTAQAASFQTDKQVPCLLNAGLYECNYEITDLAESGAANNDTLELDFGSRFMWEQNTTDCVMELAQKLNSDFYVGTGTGSNGPTIVGCATALRDDNTYATVDRTQAVNAPFRSNVFTSAVPTAITHGDIRKDLALIAKRSGVGRPDIAFAGSLTLVAIKNSFDSSKEYSVPTTWSGPRQQMVFDGSVPAVVFDGCLFIEDKDCPEGEINYINSRFTWFEVLPKVMNLKDVGNDKVRELLRRIDSISQIPGATPITGFAFHELARNGSSDRNMVSCQVQVRFARPNSCGRRTNILY